tara:strand:+ start:1274 stop:1903 length:630 start_codon:yes stop_codon:yes gene_type:complete
MKIRSNNPAVEAALQKIADAALNADRKASRKIDLGPGMRSLHEADDVICLESTGGRGGGGSSCKKWLPRRGRDKAGKPTLKFIDGAINGVFAENIHTPISYTEKTQLQYIVADITADEEEGITKFTIAVTTEAEEAILEEAAGSPPSPAKFLLGGILGTSVYMSVCSNLSARVLETRKSAREPEFLGAEPFERYYRWDIVQATELVALL